MSYILEALQRSQRAREQGQVPRLERLPPLDGGVPGARSRMPLWAWVAIGLAALAVLISLYTALRLPLAPDLPPQVGPAAAPPSAPPLVQPLTQPLVSSVAPAADAPSPAPAPLEASSAPEDESPGPLPPDLVADIEAFKEAVRREQGQR